MAHSPTPWRFVRRGPGIYIECKAGHVATMTVSPADAAFIECAVNAHDVLVSACQAVVDARESGDLAAAARQCTQVLQDFVEISPSRQ